MKYLLLLLLAGCTNPHLKPDEFRVDVGQGSMDGRNGSRDTNSDMQWGSIGWTWYCSAPPPCMNHEDAYLTKLYEVKEVPVAPLPVQTPAPEQKEPCWRSLLPYAPALILALLAILNKLGKVSWLNQKEAAGE